MQDGEGYEVPFGMGRVMKFHAAWKWLQNNAFQSSNPEKIVGQKGG